MRISFGTIIGQIQRASFYLLLVLVLATEAVVTVYFVPQSFKKIQDLRLEIDSLGSEVAVLTSAASVLGNTDKGKVASDLSKATAALPDEKKVSGLVSGLTNLASSSGVAVQILEFTPGRISTTSATSEAATGGVPSETMVGGDVRAVPATLAVVANLDNTLDFLNRLRRASQILGVTQVNYTGAIGPLSSSQMSLLIYYQPLTTSAVVWSKVSPLTASEEKVLSTLGLRDIFSLPTTSR